MKMNTDGLIIKEHKTSGDDRLVTVLTRDFGVIRAFVRGAKRAKSKAQCGSQLFSYADMSIYKGRDAYIIDEIQPKEIFFELRTDIEKVALAQYFCELAYELAPQEDNADDFLRLILNSLHMLAKGKRPQKQLKAIAELRSVTLAGYMPDIEECFGCSDTESEEMYFCIFDSHIYCENCVGDIPCIFLPIGVLTAMRYICYSSNDKLFSFTVSDENLDILGNVCEQYLLEQTKRNYKTLEFYKAVKL